VKFLWSLMLIPLSSCGDLSLVKPKEQSSSSTGYAYGDCGQNRIFYTGGGGGQVCMYIRPGRGCDQEPLELDILSRFAVPRTLLQATLNRELGPDAFYDLDGDDAVTTVGVETIRGIKRALASAEKQHSESADQELHKEAWVQCTDNGRRPDPQASRCIEDYMSRRSKVRSCL
jgi:hypothetical protein